MTLHSLVAVYMAHVMSDGIVFGTSNGSLSLVALALSLLVTMVGANACPCQNGK
jgi:hypothetical protein